MESSGAEAAPEEVAALAEDPRLKYLRTRGLPLRVHDILFEGQSRTRLEFLQREFRQVWEAETLDELRRHAMDARERLRAFDIFSEVHVELDAAPEEAGPSAALVRVALAERDVFYGSMGVHVGMDGKAEGGGALGVRNVLGWAESVELHTAAGFKDYTFDLRARQPAFGGRIGEGEARLFNVRRTELDASSFVDDQTGVAVSHAAPWGAPGGPWVREIIAEAAVRTASDPTGVASRRVRALCGPSVKCCAKVVTTRDTRDSSSHPRSGSLLTLAAELAGLGPGTRFIRLDITGQAPHVVSDTSEIVLSARAAFLLPWAARSISGAGAPGAATCLSDRFYLGGPGSLRGFHRNAVGPSAPQRAVAPAAGSALPPAGTPSPPGRCDSLGGDLLAAVGVAWAFNLPGMAALSAAGLRGQVFANAGNVVEVWGPDGAAAVGRGATESLRQLWRGLRLSIGAGFTYPVPGGRLELYAARALLRDAGDRTAAWQFGFAASI